MNKDGDGYFLWVFLVDFTVFAVFVDFAIFVLAVFDLAVFAVVFEAAAFVVVLAAAVLAGAADMAVPVKMKADAIIDASSFFKLLSSFPASSHSEFAKR